MRNYLFKIKYDGFAFHGWQLQPNGITVQQCISEAINRIFSQKVTVHGCSRTDSGVHANEFCFSCKLETDMSCEKMIYALNAVLPEQIAVTDCEIVDDGFHARFDCKGKEYVYIINNAKVRDPFLVGRAYHYKYKLDEKMLDEQAKDFIGTHDFASFCAAGSSVKDTVRTVYDFTVTRDGDEVIFKVCGDGFLYNMVRIAVGTLLDISRGKLECGSIPKIIESKDRSKAGVTAPACGLYLNKVFYGENKNEQTE